MPYIFKSLAAIGLVLGLSACADGMGTMGSDNTVDAMESMDGMEQTDSMDTMADMVDDTMEPIN